MKWIALIFVLATAPAFANEVVLDRGLVDIEGQVIQLVRTDLSPKKVTLRAQLESYEIKCVERGIVVVDGPHPSCGQYTTQELNCHNRSMTFGTCDEPSTWDSYSTRIHNNSCVHEEIQCVQFDRITHGLKEEFFTVNFINLPKLRPGQRETFQLSIRDWAAASTQPRSSFYTGELKRIKTLKKYKVISKDTMRTFDVKKTFLGL